MFIFDICFYKYTGNFNMNGDKYDLMGDIRSNPLTSTFHGSLHMAKNYLSTKATVQYQFEDNQPHVLDFSAKLQDSSKGTIIKDGIYITVQVCRTEILYYSMINVTCECKFSEECVYQIA